MRSRTLMLLAIAALVTLVLPTTWPQPIVTGSFIPRDGDPDSLVLVRSWHSNVRVSSVGFCLNLDKPNAQGQSFVCGDLYAGSGKGASIVSFWGLNRLTFPRTQEMKLGLPLAKLVREGSIAAGRVRGWVAVTVIHVKGGPRSYTVGRGYAEGDMTVRLPFELEAPIKPAPAPAGADGGPW